MLRIAVIFALLTSPAAALSNDELIAKAKAEREVVAHWSDVYTESFR